MRRAVGLALCAVALLVACASDSKSVTARPRSTAQADFETLIVLRDEIAHDKPWWDANGLSLVEWGPNASRDRVKVGVRAFTPEQAQAVLDRYGPLAELYVSTAVPTVPDGRPPSSL